MKGCADLFFGLGHPQMVYQALAPEMEDELQRSRASLELGEGYLSLRIEAEDVVSLRAAVNTWLRLVKIAMEMIDI